MPLLELYSLKSLKWLYLEFRVKGLGSKLLKGGYIGDEIGEFMIIGAITGDTRSLDYGSLGEQLPKFSSSLARQGRGCKRELHRC